jgi:hypothetical protein
MIIDAQAWDAKHAADAEDREYKQTVLRSNLTQQAFENEMAKNRFDLSVRGENRLAESLALEGQAQAFSQRMRTEEAGRDKLRLKIAEEKNERDREIHNQNMIQAKRMTEPTDVNLGLVIEPHMTKNGAFMTELNEYFMDNYGASVDVDLLPKVPILDNKGQMTGQSQVMQMSRLEQQDQALFVTGLLAKYDDPNQNAKTNIENLEVTKRDLKGIINKDSTSLTDKAFARRELKKTQKLQDAQYATFTPENTRDYMIDRADRMVQSANYLRTLGMTDQADDLSANAKVFYEKAMAADNKKNHKLTPLYYEKLGKDGQPKFYANADFNTLDMKYRFVIPGAEEGDITETSQLPEGVTPLEPTAPKEGGAREKATARAEKAFKWGHDQLRKDLSPSSDILDTFQDQKAGINYAEGLYERLASLPQKDEDGNPIEGTNSSPRNNREAAELKRVAMDLFRENHNNSYLDYLAARKSGNPADMEEWTASALATFGYLPVKPFVKQIWRGKVKAN